jgi:hypothetical protein
VEVLQAAVAAQNRGDFVLAKDPDDPQAIS